MAAHILVPVDSSGAAWKALQYAFEQHEGEHITVLHVVDPLDSASQPSDPRVDPEKRGKKVKAQANRLFSEAALDGTAFDVVIREGKPVHNIVQFADETDVDQIVIGSRGLSETDKLLIGSVADAVVRRASVPVNVIR